MSQSWFYLLIAGIMEVAWTIGLKYSAGFSRLIPSIITLVAIGLSMFYLAQAMKQLPISTSYAVWTGIGTVGATIFGIILFKEEFSLPKIFFVSLIVIGIIGLKIGVKEQNQGLDSKQEQSQPEEIGGPTGPEPTRYGDWERKGRTSDF